MTNQKGFAITALLVAAVIILAGIGGYYWLKKPANVTVSPTPTATANPTANWKTYQNEKYGFELKYPQNWMVEENAKVGSPDGRGISIREGYWRGFNIYDLGNIRNTDYKNLPILENSDYVMDAQTIIIENQTVKLNIVRNPADVEIGYPVDLVLKHNGYLLTFMGFFNEDSPNPKEKDDFIIVFKQILSTFKFTK